MTDKAIDSIDFSKFTDNKPLIAAIKMFVGRKHVDDIVDLTIDMSMAITAYKLAENELKMTDNKVTQSKAIVDCEHKKKNPHKYRVGTPFYAAFFAYKSAKHDPESLSDGDIVDRTIAAYEAAKGDGCSHTSVTAYVRASQPDIGRFYVCDLCGFSSESPTPRTKAEKDQ